jgi:predicted TIM-barrel fold metal-dependent hydrolase
MRLIAVEEHFEAPIMRNKDVQRLKLTPDHPMASIIPRLEDLGEKRIADMDAGGVDMQVVSHGGGIEQLELDDALVISRESNDHLAAAIAKNPDRLAGFAALPVAAPEEAANELERAVKELGLKGALINGQSHGRFLDAEFFWPIFERAERLDVPIYLHPGEPPDAVYDAYYADIPGPLAGVLSTAGWGWHVDTGLHAIRLMLGGVFKAFPRLQVIIGHMGEALPFFVARASGKLTRSGGPMKPLEETLAENFYITPSGVFDFPPFLCALMVVGADRMLFAVDYPISETKEGSDFLLQAPISESDRAKIAHKNAERLLKIPPKD